MLFALILFLMLTGSINYDLSLGFVLTFLLGSLFLTSSYHAFSNLSGLAIESGPVSPVFAGEDARFSVLLDSGGSRRSRIAIASGEEESFHDFEKTSIAQFRLKAEKRGWLHPGRFTVSTFHPLGLFRAWSYVELAMPCLVYPRPLESEMPASSGASGRRGKARAGSEDFSGLRPYRHGDAASRIAWKSAASGGELQVKEFEEPAGVEPLWLDWYHVQGDVEERLSRLTALVLDAGRFGLRLPDKTIPLGEGEKHKLLALAALALFEA